MNIQHHSLIWQAGVHKSDYLPISTIKKKKSQADSRAENSAGFTNHLALRGCAYIFKYIHIPISIDSTHFELEMISTWWLVERIHGPSDGYVEDLDKYIPTHLWAEIGCSHPIRTPLFKSNDDCYVYLNM